MTRIVENRQGVSVSTEAVEVSAGAADAGRIPQLDASGKLDVSLIPSGSLLADGDYGDIIVSGSGSNMVVEAILDGGNF